MNYIKELNAFKNWLLLNEIPTSAIVLWHTLMTINNATHWKREFNAPNSVVRKLSGLSKQGLLNARGHLIDHGRIHCKKGKRGQAPIYEMVPFGQIVDPSISQSVSQMSARSEDESTSNGPARESHVSRTASNPETRDSSTCPADSNRDACASHSVDPLLDQSTAPLSDQSSDQSRAESWPIHKQKQKMKQDSSRMRAMLSAGDPVSLYEKNIGKLRPFTEDLIKAWCIERGEALVTAAIELAVKRGARTFRYVETILKEWASKDIMTLDEMQAFEQEKRANTTRTVSFCERRDDVENTAFFEALRKEGALS